MNRKQRRQLERAGGNADLAYQRAVNKGRSFPTHDQAANVQAADDVASDPLPGVDRIEVVDDDD